MKLSIAWIFDHIDADWKKIDVEQLVARFNTTTAEIEHFYKRELNLSLFSIARVTAPSSQKITVFSAEWNKEFSFEHRAAKEGDLFLIKKDGWATLRDLQGEKDGLVPALLIDEKDVAGVWKKNFEAQDYILEVDNKSITNRPDMWSHRGFAREIAAIFDLPLKPLSTFLEQHAVKTHESSFATTATEPLAVRVENREKIKQFSGLYLNQAAYAPSLWWMAHRLIKVDSRPINAVVDITNYVMQDLGQPMHAFDAATIATKEVQPRLARVGEAVTLLDDQKVELAPTDIVITDGKKPLALAGIMGGKESGISPATKSIFLEAACFDAATIRTTSARLRLRTDASARFEKSLDSHGTVPALQRFLKLASPLAIKATGAIVSVGKEVAPPVINISQAFIDARLGMPVAPERVVKILEKLEFGVKQQSRGNGVEYTITVPTFRATKDVAIKEDIVEEVGRFIGYKNIPLVLPALAMKPVDISATSVLRELKNQCAYALGMHEVHNYAFFDEEFLAKLAWQPRNAVAVKNPVSENWKSLVTSLVPHLFKNVQQNELKEDRLRFFECGRVWAAENKEVREKKSIAGIFFDRKKSVDFYAAKADLQSLFEALRLEIVWEKPQNAPEPWYNVNQTAVLRHGETVIGYAGKVDASLFARVATGDAFVFELDGDFVMSYRSALKKFVPLSKYPTVWLDISMLVPLSVTVANVAACVAGADNRIMDVALIDFFEKEEWKDRRSLTFRYYAQDKEKTLERESIDAIATKVVRAVKQLGVEVR